MSLSRRAISACTISRRGVSRASLVASAIRRFAALRRRRSRKRASASDVARSARAPGACSLAAIEVGLRSRDTRPAPSIARASNGYVVVLGPLEVERLARLGLGAGRFARYRAGPREQEARFGVVGRFLQRALRWMTADFGFAWRDTCAPDATSAAGSLAPQAASNTARGQDRWPGAETVGSCGGFEGLGDVPVASSEARTDASGRRGSGRLTPSSSAALLRLPLTRPSTRRTACFSASSRTWRRLRWLDLGVGRRIEADVRGADARANRP